MLQKKRSKRVSGAWSFAFEHSDLLPQREDFKSDIHATAEESTDCGKECGYQIEHESIVVTRVNVARSHVSSSIASH